MLKKIYLKIRGIVKSVCPDIVKKVFRKMRRNVNEKGHKEVFSEIYQNNIWGKDDGGGFYSGTGSDDDYSIPYANTIIKFIDENNISSVVDLGCGDFRVGDKINKNTQIKYVGVDVVPDLIKHHQQKYQTDKIKFKQLNIVKDQLPAGQLCLIRQVLQHLSNSDIQKILAKCKQYQYLIVTEHLPTMENVIPNKDKPYDESNRLSDDSGVYLDQPPFNKQVRELLTVFPKAEENSKIVTFLVS